MEQHALEAGRWKGGWVIVYQVAAGLYWTGKDGDDDKYVCARRYQLITSPARLGQVLV